MIEKLIHEFQVSPVGQTVIPRLKAQQSQELYLHGLTDSAKGFFLTSLIYSLNRPILYLASDLNFALNLYLEILNITFRKFATSIDTTDSNLKKYLSGERKFSTDLAFKFSNFFHTTPDLWISIDVKNELINLKAQKKQIGKYRKYDYEKILA